MATYYVVNPWSVNLPDAGNTGGFPQVAAGTFSPQDGDAYILDGSLACSITFTGNATFSVDILQSLTAGAHVGGMNVSFLCGTNATVNVASGVDADFANLLASNQSLTVNLGDNVKIGGVFAATCDKLIVEGGDNVSINSTMVGSWKSSSVILGDDANLNGVLSFDASGTYLVADTQTFIVGDNAEFRFGIAMNGSYSNNTFVTGENATITGTVGMSGSGDNASATINIGNGSTVTGDVVANGSLLNVDIDLGSGVTVRNIHMNGSYIDGNIKVGADSVVTGVYASGSYSNICVGLADGTTVTAQIVMNGSLNSQSLVLGDDVSVAFSISMGGSRNVQSLDLGDGVFVGHYILQSGGLNVNHSVVGDNFVLGLAWVGSSSGSEYVEIGNNWRIGQYLSLQGGDDSLILGSAAAGVNARILGSCGFDSISVTPPAGQEAAFAVAALAAGWTQAADGTWGSNGRTLTFAGVTYSEFEGSGVEHEDWDITCPTNGIVDGTFGNDLMQIGYTDDQGDQIDGTDGLNDRIQAYNGDDTIQAGLGNDSVYGGSGNDSVSGDEGNDILYGGTGNDTLSGGEGNDQLFGGNGNDQISTGGGDIALGGAGDDAFTLATGEAAADINIVINGGSNGAGGGDVLNTSSNGSAQTIVLASGSNSGALGGLDADGGADVSFTGVESIITGSGDDLVVGGGEGSSIAINTGAGADKVVQSYNPAAGSVDSYNGGAGTDTFVLAFTAAQWATPAAQAEVAAYLAHLNAGNSAVPFTFASINTTVTNFEVFEVTVNGVNQNPATAGVTANGDAIAYTENGLAPVAVDLLLNDVVPDRAASVQMLTASNFGSLTLATSLLATTQTANLLFVPDDAALQSLRDGQIIVELLTYRVTDVDGNIGDAIVTITITGTNDLATITGVATGSTNEDALSAITGSLTITDADTGEAAFQTPASLTGTYGSFTFNPATGAWAYTPTPNAALQSLAVGQQVSDSLIVTSADGTATQTITVSITGENDAPTLAAAVASVDEDAPSLTLDLATLGDDIDSDDDGSSLTYSITGAPSVGSASISGTTLTFNGGAGLDTLAAGDSLSTVITITAEDGNGGSVSSDVTVTITGTNDAPTLAAAVASVDEDAPSLTLDLAPLGDDIDSDDDGSSLTYTITGAPSVGTASISGTTLTFNGGAGLDTLAAGDSLTTVITITAEDGNGGSVSSDVTVTITGTNDAPTLTAGALAAVEDAPAVTLDLATLGDDIDSDDDGTTLSYTISAGPALGTATLVGSQLVYDAGTAFDYLSEGEQVTQDIEITAMDSYGEMATSLVTVTITGSNDAPIGVGPAPDPTVIANGDLITVTGTVSFVDPDFNDTHFASGTDPFGNLLDISETGSAQNGGVGEWTWTITIDINQAPAGTELNFDWVLLDSAGAAIFDTVTYIVPGSINTAPIVTDPITVATAVGDGVTTLSVTDYYLDEQNDPMIAVPDPLQQYPGIVFNGTDQFDLNSDDPAYQFLTLGESQTFTYTYLVSDGTDSTPATLLWTLSGSRTGIIGTAGADVLTGVDFQSELLNGGAGDDTLTGGIGEDVFAYLVAADGFDLITDFTTGEDRIGISVTAFGGNLVKGGTATVLNTADFSTTDSGGTDGVFIAQVNGIDVTLFWDADGGLGDNAIQVAQLTGVTDLSQSDFFLFI